MRLVYVLIAMLLAAPISTPAVAAQPQLVTLYAHSNGTDFSLNALPQWGTGQKIADISSQITFKLVPTLGGSLRIQGPIIFTVYLQATSAMIGDIIVELTELKSTGSEVSLHARIDAPVSLDTRATPTTLGVEIDYQFSPGSSIVLHLLLNRLSVSGVPYLVWDSPATPTNVSLPANAMKTQFTYSGQFLSFDKVLQSDQNGRDNLTIVANVTDVIGDYRLTGDSQFTLVSPNGTIVTLTPRKAVLSPYMIVLSSNTISGVGEWQIKAIMRDAAGQSYEFKDTFSVVPFHDVTINVTDVAGIALTNITVAVCARETCWVNKTDSLGLLTFTLPSSSYVGPLNMTITWNAVSVQNSTLDVERDSTFLFRLKIFTINLRVAVSGLPLPNAEVNLLQGGKIVARGATDMFGDVSIPSIPAGKYTMSVSYLFGDSVAPLDVAIENQTVMVNLPLPQQVWLLLAGIVVLGAITTIQLDRRKRKTVPTSFDYFNEMTSGGLPQTCFTVIAGDSGSGKSALLESIAGEHLQVAGCVYITNVEYPAKIREDMLSLGVVPVDESCKKRIIFIDAYAAMGGAQSKEEFHVSSLTDLTGLGLQISQCLERLGSRTDVYLDSLNPLINALRIDYLLNFLQSIAAKVKANDGKLCVTIGTGTAKSDLTKLEENSDCVIETQLQEARKGQRRKLRVKKLRGKAYVDRWTQFQVESRKGIVFFAPKKTPKQS